MQKVCNLLNGYQEKKDGSLIPISGFIKKQITLETQ